MSDQRGFTLIEVMVAISIMAILTSVIIGPLNKARQSGTDALRISQLAQIRNALELYYDNNKVYPNTPCDSRATLPNCWGPGGAFYQRLVPTYMSSLPLDPNNNSSSGYMCANCGEYLYTPLSSNTKYILSTYLSTNHPKKKGIKWNNYVEVPGVTLPPFFHAGSSLYGPFYSITSPGCIITNFASCN